MPYYQTIPKRGKELKDANRLTNQQDKNCLLAIRAIVKAGYTPTARIVWHMYCTHKGPIELTSVRRSINTLHNKKYILYGPIKEHRAIKNIYNGEKFITKEKTIHLL